MLRIQENIPLKPLTTFKIGGPTRFFVETESAADALAAARFASAQKIPLFVLGGGSNVLISDHGVNALVIHPVSSGIFPTSERNGSIHTRVEAGHSWDRLVGTAVENGWWGIENLSHIPGTAGAATVQNIGAYGQQLSDVLENVEALELESGSVRSLRPEECGLGYRRSIFNSTRKGKDVILSLTLRLSGAASPRLSYPDVKNWFAERGVAAPALAEIRAAVTAIRDSKFPFPVAEIGGNAGSFFKNITVNEAQYAALEKRVLEHFGNHGFDQLRELRRRFPASSRIPTAFLISLCGLKGRSFGRASISETQPLVLLNQGGAGAADVLSLARIVRRTVHRKTGITIEIEPELVGFKPDELVEYLAIEDPID